MFTEHNLQLIHGRGNREARRRCLVKVLVEDGLWKEGGRGGQRTRRQPVSIVIISVFMIYRFFCYQVSRQCKMTAEWKKKRNKQTRS